MSAPAIEELVAEARRIAAADAPLRDRLAELIELQSRAGKIAEPRERRMAELAIFEAASPLLDEFERPVRPVSAPSEELSENELGREVRAAAIRRARREALLPRAGEIPVEGPRWAGAILDTGEGVLAVHRETAAAYPLALFRDLDEEASAAVVAGRLAARGFTREHVREVLEALEIPAWARLRVLRALEGGEA